MSKKLNDLKDGSVVCTVFYAVIMSVLGSVAASVTWPSDNYLSWFCARIPVLCFALVAVLFYTKVFCDDLRCHATNGGMLGCSCLSWGAFIMQMATIRNLSITLSAFIVGMAILTIGMCIQNKCAEYVKQNLFYFVYALILLVVPDAWKHLVSLGLVVYGVVILFSTKRHGGGR